jgi:hypothetical protein
MIEFGTPFNWFISCRLSFKLSEPSAPELIDEQTSIPWPSDHIPRFRTIIARSREYPSNIAIKGTVDTGWQSALWLLDLLQTIKFQKSQAEELKATKYL